MLKLTVKRLRFIPLGARLKLLKQNSKKKNRPEIRAIFSLGKAFTVKLYKGTANSE